MNIRYASVSRALLMSVLAFSLAAAAHAQATKSPSKPATGQVKKASTVVAVQDLPGDALEPVDQRPPGLLVVLVGPCRQLRQGRRCVGDHLGEPRRGRPRASGDGYAAPNSGRKITFVA